MKVVGLIQARMGSTRLPGKVLKSVAGISMVELILFRLSKCKELDQIVVAASKEKENEALQDIVESHGYKCTRGSEKDVLKRFYESANSVEAEIIVH